MVTVFGSICPKLRTIAYGQDIWTNIPLSFRSENGRIWLPNLCGFSREIEDPKITQWLLDMISFQDAYLRPRLLPVSVSHELVRSRAERMLCEIDRRMGLEDGEAQSLT
ncbi:hypothetical protein BT96DRAFT_926102 [Gymnopus androsaceus JB14]|uniref:Uncharacterized protein n=1 Tax=Gymnopus androsaceus JB14 TaxID=1447944 RepID=A0A6A4GYP0_9AGAR|nr:hypothetical protein BT96DRAFT_926102 [Gymnopus androsaceus JB14]